MLVERGEVENLVSVVSVKRAVKFLESLQDANNWGLVIIDNDNSGFQRTVLTVLKTHHFAGRENPWDMANEAWANLARLADTFGINVLDEDEEG